MSEFQRRRAALYAEFPEEATAYESEFVDLQRQLGETNDALAACQSEGNAWKHRAELLEFRLRTDRQWVLDTLSDFAAKVARDRATETVNVERSAPK